MNFENPLGVAQYIPSVSLEPIAEVETEQKEDITTTTPHQDGEEFSILERNAQAINPETKKPSNPLIEILDEPTVKRGRYPFILMFILVSSFFCCFINHHATNSPKRFCRNSPPYQSAW